MHVYEHGLSKIFELNRFHISGIFLWLKDCSISLITNNIRMFAVNWIY